MKLYVASSWRNTYYPGVLQALREAGLVCYDFREPVPGDNGFHWSSIDPNWKQWTPQRYREMLMNPIAQRGFKSDYRGMSDATGCVLVLPCGRSAHLEAGWFIGRMIPTAIYIPEPVEPELMYLLADVERMVGPRFMQESVIRPESICSNMDELISLVRSW